MGARGWIAVVVSLAALACVDPRDTPPALDGAASSPLDGGASLPRPDGGPSMPSRPQDFVEGLADPLAPARLRPGNAYLFSSREPEPPEGLRNHDHSNYLRMSAEGRGVLAEDEGPGVITRMWFTIGGRPDPAIGDPVRIHVWIDGRELQLVPGSRGVTLAELTSGELAGLPRPWALDRTRASSGFLVTVPIQYAESMRIEIEPMPDIWTYYQIDGRALPLGTEVTPFDLRDEAAHDDALARATELWVDHAHPGDDVVDEPRLLAPGEAIARTLEGPGVITTLEVSAARGLRDDLEVVLEVDGEEAARAPLGWLTGSAPPGGPYDSSLSAADEVRAALYAPIPFAASARVTVRNAASEGATIGLRLRVLEGALDRDVGRFVAMCSRQVVDIPESSCAPGPLATYPNVLAGGELSGRGQYAGQTFVMRTEPGTEWWCALECDHEVFVDGAPSLLGTGTEDYFGGAFYFALGPFATPTCGASGWVRSDTGGASGTHMFRWHLVDGIPFERSLRFEYESYVDGTTWDGCVFGYLARD